MTDEFPVLYRCVLYPLYPIGNPEEMAGTNLLRSFPRYFLYGGPTTAGILRSPAGVAFRKGMLAWAISQQKGLRSEAMPIVGHGEYETYLPYQDWRWFWRLDDAHPGKNYALALRLNRYPFIYAKR